MIHFILTPNDPDLDVMHLTANSKEEVLSLLKQDAWLYENYNVDFFKSYVWEGIYRDYYSQVYKSYGDN